MPKVGKKKFPYTRKGMAEAMEYAKKSGMPMSLSSPPAPKREKRKRRK